MDSLGPGDHQYGAGDHRDVPRINTIRPSPALVVPVSDQGPGADADVDAVRRTYDRIAEHFASTRRHPWPEVEAFLEGRGGTVGLDLGCANGRHLEPLAERTDRAAGTDLSRSLLRTAAERARERGYADRITLFQADAAATPLAAAAVDVAVYVATLHHLPTREARVGSLDELARVLAPDGAAVVSAWSVAADRFDRDVAHDATVEWTLPGGETVPRFYHVYDREEFEADLARSALAVERTFQSSGNCYAVVESA
jgi:tRNA (uracil-5-)-methyltransferase TRM9